MKREIDSSPFSALLTWLDLVLTCETFLFSVEYLVSCQIGVRLTLKDVIKSWGALPNFSFMHLWKKKCWKKFKLYASNMLQLLNSFLYHSICLYYIWFTGHAFDDYIFFSNLSCEYCNAANYFHKTLHLRWLAGSWICLSW